jgi:hypothetical protein
MRGGLCPEIEDLLSPVLSENRSFCAAFNRSSPSMITFCSETSNGFAEGRGQGVGPNSATRSPLPALEQTIVERQTPPGFVHHSDRGVQYAAGDDVRILRKHQMIPSMSRPTTTL